MSAAVTVRLLKRDLLFIIEKLVNVMDENRVEMLARQHGIRQKRDDGGIGKTLTAFVRRADEGTLSRLIVEASILLASSRANPTVILKEAATTYKVDTEAIAAKVKQEVRSEGQGEEGSATSGQGRKESRLVATGKRAANLPPVCLRCIRHKTAAGRHLDGFSLHPLPSSFRPSARRLRGRRRSPFCTFPFRACGTLNEVNGV